MNNSYNKNYKVIKYLIEICSKFGEIISIYVKKDYNKQ